MELSFYRRTGKKVFFEHWSTEEGEAIDTTQPINSNTNLYPVFAARTDIPYKVLHYYETLDGSFVLKTET